MPRSDTAERPTEAGVPAQPLLGEPIMYLRFDHPVGPWRDLAGEAVAPLPVEAYERDGAEAAAAWLGADGRLRARCSLWWSRTPMLDGRRVGLIGHYAADGVEAGTGLLKEACVELRRAGCSLAAGPMDGSTWGRYRLIIDQGDEPAFFLEPDYPAEWTSHFAGAGFEVLARYRSCVCDDLTVRDGRSDRVAGRLAEEGVRVRPLSMDRLEEDLRAIHGVSLEAFRSALLYQPIPYEALRRRFEPIVDRIDPELVLLAERAGDVVGFAFGVPDLREAARGRSIDTMILKTLAVRPDRSLAGLGALLLQRCHDAARQRGMRRAIHALMHEGNPPVLALSARHARPIRRYGLFARKLR